MDALRMLGSIDGAICGEGASEEEITAAENSLGLKFAKDYAFYLKSYGAVMVNGHALTGLSKSKLLDVVSNTEREKELDRNISNDMYVIENIAIDGIIIWQNPTGYIFESSYNGIKKISKSYSEYLQKFVF